MVFNNDYSVEFLIIRKFDSNITNVLLSTILFKYRKVGCNVRVTRAYEFEGPNSIGEEGNYHRGIYINFLLCLLLNWID